MTRGPPQPPQPPLCQPPPCQPAPCQAADAAGRSKGCGANRRRGDKCEGEFTEHDDFPSLGNVIVGASRPARRLTFRTVQLADIVQLSRRPCCIAATVNGA
jgi:hypothetical protein